MPVDADLIARMLVQLQFGTAKQDFPGGLPKEASALWDQLGEETAAIKAAGGAVEPPARELPTLPKVTPADRDAAAAAGD